MLNGKKKHENSLHLVLITFFWTRNGETLYGLQTKLTVSYRLSSVITIYLLKETSSVSALGILHIAEKNGLTDFSKLVGLTGLKKTIETSENLTVFIPSNEAIQVGMEKKLDCIHNYTCTSV